MDHSVHAPNQWVMALQCITPSLIGWAHTLIDPCDLPIIHIHSQLNTQIWFKHVMESYENSFSDETKQPNNSCQLYNVHVASRNARMRTFFTNIVHLWFCHGLLIISRIYLLDVITHPCLNFNDGSLMLGHGWAIAPNVLCGRNHLSMP